MSQTDLEHRLFGSSKACTFARPDYGQMHQELRRKGVTGAGKSWLACALAQHACRRGQSAYYQRVPRLSEELRSRAPAPLAAIAVHALHAPSFQFFSGPYAQQPVRSETTQTWPPR